MSGRIATLFAVGFGLVAAVHPSAAQDHVLDLISVADARDAALLRFIDRQLNVMGQSDPEARRAAREQIERRAWRAALPSLLREIRPRRRRPQSVSVILTLERIGGHEAESIVRRVLLDDHYRRSERVAAALVLGRMGGEAATRAIAAVARQQLPGELRVAVALAAARLEDQRLVVALRRLASNGSRAGRVTAALALARHRSGVDVVSAVDQLGRSNHPASRRVACLIAAEMQDPSTGRMLRRNADLENNDPWSSACAVVAIGSRRSGQFEPLIRRKLRSSEVPVRRYAAHALGWFDTESATKALRAAVQSRANATQPEVREAIGRALARRGDATLAPRFLLELGHPGLRAAGLVMLESSPDAVQRIDSLLMHETDDHVASVALSLRLIRTGAPLPLEHPARRARCATSRVLRRRPWMDLDRYRGEPGAPPWDWARRPFERERAASSMQAVHGGLLDSVMLELLELDRLLEVTDRRIVGSIASVGPRIGVTRERRRANELSFVQKDLKLWLLRRGYFRP